MSTFVLNNGVSVLFPPIVLGTGTIRLDGRFAQFVKKKCEERSLFYRLIRKLTFPIIILPQQLEVIRSVYWALKCGYRMIDTSSAYNNLHLIRIALKLSGVKREEVFITTRVSNKQQFSKLPIVNFLQKDLKKLGITYIDLYMFHWPVTDHFVNTWMQMEEIYKAGYARSIGVANCNIYHLKEILRKGTITPMVNQFEVHPFFTQKKIIKFCKENNIQIEAYTPLGRNNKELLTNEELLAIANKYNKTIPQIILRWNIQNGIIPIPKSRNKDRLKQNINIFDFELTSGEILTVDNLNRDMRLRYDPDTVDFTKC